VSDSTTRAQLETTQAELKRLKQQLADWPTLSDERRQLKTNNSELETEVQSLSLKVDSDREREITLRDTLDSGQAGRAWWKSPIAPYMGVAAVLGGWWAANQALQLIDWWYWSPRLSPWLLALAPVINLCRWAYARRKRHLRIARIKATSASN
jgi:hypothetical protein